MSDLFQKETEAKPFLKWAGGKTQLLETIHKKIPYEKSDSFTYIEPFVGSGAVFFSLVNYFPNIKRVVINDINSDLINVYVVLQKNVDDLIEVLQTWQQEYHVLLGDLEEQKKYYYEKRTEFNKREKNKIVHAALFLFLNRTCFNGLYRVNSRNEFNVPIGSYKAPQICNAENLLLVHKALEKAEILNEEYKQTLPYAQKETLFYLDPPYKPINKTSSFTSYSKEGFDDEDQKKLKYFCDSLSNNNYRWILSNSDVKSQGDDDFFDELYKEYTIARIDVRRNIHADSSKRSTIKELVISYGVGV